MFAYAWERMVGIVEWYQCIGSKSDKSIERVFLGRWYDINGRRRYSLCSHIKGKIR